MSSVEAFTREIGVGQTDNVAAAGPYGADVVLKVTVTGMFIGGAGLGATDSETHANGYEIKPNVEYKFRIVPQVSSGTGDSTLFLRNASGAVTTYSTYLTRLA